MASDSIGSIDMPGLPVDSLAPSYVLGYQFFTVDETDEINGIRSIEVVIRPKIHCQIQPSESLICANTKTPNDIFNAVRTTFYIFLYIYIFELSCSNKYNHTG